MSSDYPSAGQHAGQPVGTGKKPGASKKKNGIEPAGDPNSADNSYKKQATIAAWIFGGVLILFILAVFFLFECLSDDRRSLLRFVMALLSAFFATFFLGGVVLRGKILDLAISATGGIALFVLLITFVNPIPASRCGGREEVGLEIIKPRSDTAIKSYKKTDDSNTAYFNVEVRVDGKPAPNTEILIILKEDKTWWFQDHRSAQEGINELEAWSGEINTLPKSIELKAFLVNADNIAKFKEIMSKRTEDEGSISDKASEVSPSVISVNSPFFTLQPPQ
jgi:hypothetical protein